MPRGTGTENTMARIPILALALAGLLTGLRPQQVDGQSIPSPYRFFETRQEAGVFVGVTNQGTGQFGFGPKSGLLVGARYGLHLGGAFGLEGVIGYQPTTRDIVDPTRAEGDRVVGEADVEMVSFDARLRFSLTGDRAWKGLNPFLFMGGGVIWDMAGESEADALVLSQDRFEMGTRFVALIGGGVRWLLTERVVVRGDIALALNQLKTPEGFLDPERGLGAIGEKEWESGPVLSIGLGYHF